MIKSLLSKLGAKKFTLSSWVRIIVCYVSTNLRTHFNDIEMKITIYLLVPILSILSQCSTHNFNYKLDTSYSFQNGDLPSIFDKTMRDLATAKELDEIHVSEKSLERVISDLTGHSWFPRLNAYFERLNVTSRDNVDVRRYTVDKILKRMPKYNLTHFWNVPIKYLVNETAYYTSRGTDVVIDIMKGIYGSANVATEKHLVRHPSGPYINSMYSDVFKLTLKLQEAETLQVMTSFGIDMKSKLTFITHSSFDSVNEKFANLIFQKIHGDATEAKKTYNEVTKLIQSMLRYRSSLYEWSKTCADVNGNIPQTEYQTDTLNQISDRCFLQTFDVVAQKLFDISISNIKINELNMEQINVLSNTSFYENKLQSASEYVSLALKRVNSVTQKNNEPLVLLADQINIDANAVKNSTLHALLGSIHQLDWKILLKIFALNDNSKLDVEFSRLGYLFGKLNEITKFDVDVNQWRISSPEVLLKSLENKISVTEFKFEFDKSVNMLRNIRLKRLQKIFDIPSNKLQQSNLILLSQEMFGLNATDFLGVYKLNNSDSDFFQNATVNNIANLVTPLTDVRKFTMTQLITLVQPDLKLANIMLRTIKALRTAGSKEIPFTSSIVQIVEENKIIQGDLLKNYIERWSGTKDLANLLDRKLIAIMSTLGKTQNQVDQMSLLDVVTGLHITFGVTCSDSMACVSQQTCTSTMYGRLCQCSSGSRFYIKGECVDLNECTFAKVTCSENAECNNTLGSYLCTCKSGFIGDGIDCTNINECLGNHTCSTNATCTDTIGSYTCTCNSGFDDVAGDGRQCVNVDECEKLTYTCHDDANCHDTYGSYDCRCKSGFSGDGKSSCVDINECSSASLNTCNERTQYCQNTIPKYRCVCKENFLEVGDSCFECTADRLEFCPARSECIRNTCVCIHGYTQKGNSKSCEDIDECELEATCGRGKCINSIGSYSCECDYGFMLNDENSTCIDIDECSTSTVPLCNGTYEKCKNDFGSYACISEKPNTELKIGLGVAIPLIIVFLLLMIGIHYYHRRRQGSKELKEFDNKLDAMFVNRAFASDEITDDSDNVKTKPLKSDIDDHAQQRPLRYIFKKNKKPKEDPEN